MELPKSAEKLKQEGSKDDKVAVASGIAVSVVIVLFAAWAIFFLRDLSRRSQTTDLGSGAQDAFNFQSVRDAQAALQQQLGNIQTSDLEAARQESSAPAVMQAVPMQTQGQAQTDQFGTPVNY